MHARRRRLVWKCDEGAVCSEVLHGQHDGHAGGKAPGAEQQLEERFQETETWRRLAAVMPRLHKIWRKPAQADARRDTDPKTLPSS